MTTSKLIPRDRLTIATAGSDRLGIETLREEELDAVSGGNIGGRSSTEQFRGRYQLRLEEARQLLG